MLYNYTAYILNNKFYGLILLFLACIIFASLISYKPIDPSYNVAISAAPSNLLGYLGSYLADFFYQILGAGAFILPITFLAWGWLLLTVGNLKWLYIKFILIISSILIFTTSFADISSDKLPAGLGGVIGILLLNKLNGYFTLNTAILAWLNFTAAFLLVIGLGLDLNFYIDCFANITKIKKLSNIALPKFGFQKQPDSILERQAPTFTFKDNNIESNSRPIPLEDLHQNAGSQGIKSRNANSINISTILPDINLLNLPDKQTVKKETSDQLRQNADELVKVLKDFGVKGAILDINQGPVVTLYEFEPAAGTKSSRVIGLADDIARSLSAISTRISVIPGRNVLGIELPNKHREFFCLRELIETKEYQNSDTLLPIILGKDLAGKPLVVDLAKMPHLLVAGTTGSGKSVAINTMIMSLLYRYSPIDCRMIMIDPKMLELSIYDNIPHLLTPVVTESSKAIVALKWAVKEMENRYRLMSNLGVRNIANYNAKILEAKQQGKVLERTVHTGFDPETGKATYETVPIALERMPFIVIIVDEMADLMITAGKDIEASIQRLAQMARAAGLHIIMATQRPSVDVITGVIKANFPSRISFKVTSKIDSRTILGEQGSEQLVGMGDMLYMGNSAKITRVHGPFVADSEVERVTDYLKTLAVPEYVTAVIENNEDEEQGSYGDDESGSDDESLYRQAVEIVRKEKKVSISYVQRCLRIGYNKAAIIVELMEKRGVVTPANHSGKREVVNQDKD